MRAYINVADFISCWWQFRLTKIVTRMNRHQHRYCPFSLITIGLYSDSTLTVVHNIYTKQYTFHCIFYSDTINMFDKHACNSSLVFYYEIITVVKVNANAASDSRIFIEQRSSKYITVLTVPSESRDVSLTSWEPKRFRIGFEGHWAFSNSWIRRKSNSFFKETLLKLKTKNYLNLTKTFNHVVKKSLPRIFICDHFEIVSTTGLSRTFHFKVSKITRT